ncbi:unnamed protein product [Closterium sp. Yama58-4]|nr:unnamed protein product [Closterium sp. Yama58-4]
MGKTRGMGAGRKLRNHRRNQLWADKQYKKSHQGNEWKKPFMGSSHAKGIVLEKIGIEAKQPNSAIRKCARVQLKERQEDRRVRAQRRLPQLHRGERRGAHCWIRP